MRRVRENVVKSGHVVGLGSSLVLNPSRESKPIGYVDNSGRLQSEACRFTHGAGWKRFLRLQCTSRTRAEKVDLPAWIDVHEYVRAHFGPGSERHTGKAASLSLDFREKDGPRPKTHSASWLKSCTTLSYRVGVLTPRYCLLSANGNFCGTGQLQGRKVGTFSVHWFAH